MNTGTTPNPRVLYLQRYRDETDLLIAASGRQCLVTPTPMMWYVRTNAGHDIFLTEMLTNWRLVTSRVSQPMLFTGGWCYFGKGWDSFNTALDDAWALDLHTQTRPARFDKEVLAFEA